MAKNNTRKRGLGSPNMSAETRYRIQSAGGRASRSGGRKKRSDT